MKSTRICYFSGTGNTEILAEYLASAIGNKSGFAPGIVKIEDVVRDPDAMALCLKGATLIIILYPIYAFDAPEIVYEFAEKLQVDQGTQIALIKVGCDTIWLNAAASYFLKKKLSQRGIAVFHEELLAMPSNFLLSYPASLNKQLIRVSLRRIEYLAGKMLAGTGEPDPAPLIAKLTTLVCRIERIGARYVGKKFTAGADCTLCLKCVSRCPQKNIYLENSTVRFTNRCMLCMRCLYSCPARAIHPKGFRFIMIKAGYNLENILKQPDANAFYITETTKGYFKHMKSYVLEP